MNLRCVIYNYYYAMCPSFGLQHFHLAIFGKVEQNGNVHVHRHEVHRVMQLRGIKTHGMRLAAKKHKRGCNLTITHVQVL